MMSEMSESVEIKIEQQAGGWIWVAISTDPHLTGKAENRKHKCAAPDLPQAFSRRDRPDDGVAGAQGLLISIGTPGNKIWGACRGSTMVARRLSVPAFSETTVHPAGKVYGGLVATQHWQGRVNPTRRSVARHSPPKSLGRTCRVDSEHLVNTTAVEQSAEFGLRSLPTIFGLQNETFERMQKLTHLNVAALKAMLEEGHATLLSSSKSALPPAYGAVALSQRFAEHALSYSARVCEIDAQFMAAVTRAGEVLRNQYSAIRTRIAANLPHTAPSARTRPLPPCNRQSAR